MDRYAGNASHWRHTGQAPGMSASDRAIKWYTDTCFIASGATWFRRGLQSSAGHTEDRLPRKYNRNRSNCKR
ncbi:hypothetical protein CFter6_4617 [Collimonas fungivorans]|uniref:Uncharacterized protein n=1 Tax=Collimonas fungivorans TaxID=158899 RepID=A0A127PHK4_9BURK|nr:hypothetical protein CFter6_4617 [Collimonas fungivorans]